MCKVNVLFLLLLMMASCEKKGEEILFGEQYPQLYEAIYERDEEKLLAFTKHESEFTQLQAWRALISTPISDIDVFINAVITSIHRPAWIALSRRELTRSHLQQLQDLWEGAPSMRDDINVVFGEQGDLITLNFLIRNLNYIIESGEEADAALAIGKLIGRLDVSAQAERVIIQHAAIQNESQIFRGYMYGYYRFGKKIENERLQNILWETYNHSEDPLIKQYVLRISFNSNPQKVFEELDISEIGTMNVQLAVELTGLLNGLEWNEKLEEIYEKLIAHENPVVNEAALNQLQDHANKPAAFDDVIITKIVENVEKEASVRLSGILALNERDAFFELADSLVEGNEYLIVKSLSIYKDGLAADEFLTYLQDYISSENRMYVLFGTQILGEWWANLSASQKTSGRVENVRDLLAASLKNRDRSITYVAQSLLSSPEIADLIEFNYFNDLLKNFTLPEDVEVYQSISAVLKEHYENEARSLIDSLAQKGNVALNSTLAQQGWEIPETEDGNTIKFRAPDWERLVTLGFYPIWVLETEKGNIEIEMNTIFAPATISGMDSLIVNGEYNDIAFHRVVPNFVIQGGDVETGDGYGGPDYVVPTESSEIDYRRGVVGIASAGTDTEGSQYFIMHQWAPHLNSRYTVVGEVISGMDVVDRILVGDKVIRSYWKE